MTRLALTSLCKPRLALTSFMLLFAGLPNSCQPVLLLLVPKDQCFFFFPFVQQTTILQNCSSSESGICSHGCFPYPLPRSSVLPPFFTYCGSAGNISSDKCHHGDSQSFPPVSCYASSVSYLQRLLQSLSTSHHFLQPVKQSPGEES